MNEPNRTPKPSDDRMYYMDPYGGGFPPRGDLHARPKPWYNQRWVIALLLLVGTAAVVIALLLAFAGLSQEVAGVSASIDAQTEAIEEQTGALVGLRQSVAELAAAVGSGFDRLVDAVRDAASRMGGSGG
ncbi:hypothetical protein [Paenibacillus sp.]|uniref:hypothetical protein n=1 Tax=Paenibacillus sp. TaxID=58172 RepID=UPI002D380590|nr:hypothetical protein [Paenibacillus sp.]HZG84743.1 hypothetical protein [Paenibacillus sp.]